MPALKTIYQRLLPLFKGVIPKHTNYSKFIILGHARTGSNYLLSGLRQVNSVKLYDEEFAGHKRKIGEGYEEIINGIFGRVEFFVKHVGFKLFYYHMTSEELQKLLEFKDIKIIHLTRKNKLRTIVSLDRAKQNNQWIAINDQQQSSITIDCDTLITRIQEIDHYEQSFEKLTKNHPVLPISYEDLVNDPKDTFSKISEFLGVPSVSPEKITLKKQGGNSLSEDVSNSDEVIKTLSGTSYHNFIQTY